MANWFHSADMSKQVNRIEHEGRVVEISDNSISVEIVNKSACAACHAKAVCAASDEAVKIVEVPLTISSLSEDYEVGERVCVVLASSLGLKAVWLCYVLPLALLVAAVLCFSAFGCSEVRTGLFSLLTVAVYYFVIFTVRDKLSKIFTFSIEKLK